MKKFLPHLYFAGLFLLFNTRASAQTAPSISYNGPQTYTVGTAITALAPNNAGGAVPATTYGTVTTFAGSTLGFSGTTNATGTAARFTNPRGITIDLNGNIYVADYSNNQIRKITPAGVVTRIASAATFSNPYDITVDATGTNLYVADYSNNQIKKIVAATGVTTVLAGSGTAGRNNSNTSTSVTFNGPAGVVFDPVSGFLYVSDINNNEIRKVNVSTGATTLLAGNASGTAGSGNGTGSAAFFNGPNGLTTDAAGNIYVADQFNSQVRKVTPAGVVTTFAGSGSTGSADGTGTSASFDNLRGITTDNSGNLYVSDSDNNLIRMITPAGVVTTIAGSGAGAQTNGVGTAAAFNGPRGVEVDPTTGDLFVGDFNNNVIRRIVGTGYTLSGILPAGISFNYTTGTFSGTPTAVTATTTLTVTAYNAYGSSSANIALTVGSATPTTPVDINAAANTVPENSPNGTLVGLTAYSFTTASNATNIALNKTAVGSSYENSVTLAAAFAVDGNSTTTRWGSAFMTDPSYITVDLGANYDISRVRVIWENAYATAYQVQMSTDNSTFSTLRTITGNTTLTNDNTGLSTGQTSIGRYLRIYGTSRAQSIYGYSIYEVEAYRTNITYSLTNSAGGRFAIDAVTGVVSVANSSLLDYETNTSHSITVQAANGALVSTQTFTINVTNVNEAPVITSNGGGTTAAISVSENTSAVTTVVATDVDAGDTKTYTISGADAGKFSITTGGVLAFINPPNFALPASAASSNVYTVVATVTDAGGLTAVQTLTVTVTNTAFLSPYAYRLPLTLNTVSAANTNSITSNQTNFPVLVRISDPSLVYSNTSCTNKVQSPNGPAYDFAFTQATSATELNYQVESYDQVNGVLLVWVKIPTLTYQTNNSLFFYFGSATSTAATHTTAFYQATWASDYRAVFHFNETTYTGSVTDGTSGAHTGTTTGMSSTDLVTGKIGTAYSFDGSTKAVNSNAVTITGTFTLSAWVNPNAISRDQKIMTNQATGGSGTGGYKLGLYSDNTVEAESATAINRTSTPAAPTFASGAWHYVQAVYDGATLSNYVDGVQYKVFSTTINPSSTTPLYIGVGEGGATYYFSGIIDEPRVSNVAKTGDWIKYEYANQNAPATFTTSGSFTTDATNVLTIPGAVIYTYSGGSYTRNLSGAPATPSNNGKESFIIATSLTVPATFNPYALTVNSGVTLGLNGQTTNVGCNVTNNGTITYNTNNSSTLNFNGTVTTQYYTGTSAIYSSVGKLQVSNSTTGATVNINGGPLDVYSLVTLTAGSINVNAGGTLTLKSSATQTAAVDVLTAPATNKITGYVNVERYFTGGSLAANRGYRLMSSPVNQTSATVASTNTFGLTYLNNHTYLNVTYPGVYTGGVGGTGSGFSGTSNAPTIYLYKETLPASNASYLSGKHVGISAINTSGTPTSTTIGTTATVATTHATDAAIPALSIPIGNGFLMYFVGPSTRGNGSAATAPADAVMTANGYLNQGSFTVNLWYTPTGGTGKLSNTAATNPGYNMVGNPYASSINLNTVLSQNSSIDAIYVLGTRTGGTAQNYVTYVNGGTSSPTAQGYAVSGGGFIVHASAASGTTGTLTFNESQKTPTIQPTGTGLIMSAPNAGTMVVDGKMSATSTREVMVMQPQTGEQPLTGLYMKMEKDSLVYDYTGIYFKPEYSAKFGDGDAKYLNGPTATVSMASISSDGVETAVNLLPDYHKGSRVKLKVNAAATGLYYVKIEGIRNIDTLYNIYLVDKLKKDSLDIRRYGAYAFNLNKADTTTFGANRFELSIQRKQIVPVVIASFDGNKIAEGVQLKWKTYNEGNYTGFTLEKQNKSGTFAGIYDKQSDGSANYAFIDREPSSGINVYRLKQDDIDGKISYSDPIKIFYDKLGGSGLFSVFPNPTVETINVSIPVVQTTATYKLRLYNASGNLLLQKTSATGNWSENVSNVKPGTYIVEVTKSDGTSMGKTKFIKR